MRLLRLYNEVETHSGLTWYNEANEYCQQLANTYNLSLEKVCGILSALSPACNYEQNKKDTDYLIKINQGLHTKSYRFCTYGQNVIKAQKIYSSDVDPINFFNPKTGAKTFNFYQNVLNPSLGEPVTIDRHAWKLATGKDYRSQPTMGQYNHIADLYRKAAKKLNLLPCQLQAVLWVDYRLKEVARFNTYTIEAPF